MKIRTWAQLLFILLFSLMLASCQGNTIKPHPTPSVSAPPVSTLVLTPVPTDTFFPQAARPIMDQMQAAVAGKLVLVNGCPRMQGSDGSGDLLIWPYNYSIDRSAYPAEIHDDTGRVVARIGDYVEMGGGEVPSTDDKLPNGCGGPIWIVGEGPRVLDASFPQIVGPGTVADADLLEGKLVLVNGCLRLQTGENSSSLLIWPLGFSLNREENPMQVYDGAGDVEARLGEKIKIRGGEVSSLQWPPGDVTQPGLIQPLPDACSSGPYWIVNYIKN